MNIDILSGNSTKLPIMLIPYDGTEAVTVLLLVRAGSRFEDKQTSGLSHFIEHMFFKGGARYENTQAVSEAIDGVGGEFNAFTSKEYVGYYIKVAKEYVELAVDVLSDMMLNAAFPEEEFTREKQVILEEINMYEDNPMHKAAMTFESLLFGEHQLGWDIAGTKENVQSFTRDMIMEFKEDLYVKDNMLLVVAGNCTQASVEPLLESYFTFNGEHAKSDWKKFQSFPQKRFEHVKKSTEQTNIVVGMPTVSLHDQNRYGIKLLSIILGGNMSSRMFMNVRERLGLCYYVFTTSEHYLDQGYVATYAGVDTTRTDEAITAIQQEYERILEDLNNEEIERAISFMKGKLTLQLEDSEERALFFGKQKLLEGTVRNLEDVVREMEQFSAADLKKLGTEYFNDFRVVRVGP